MKTRIQELEAENEQLRVQLAGCSAAAMGVKEVAVRGDYGWSQSYQDVLELRRRYEKALGLQRSVVAVVNKLLCDTCAHPGLPYAEERCMGCENGEKHET